MSEASSRPPPPNAPNLPQAAVTPPPAVAAKPSDVPEGMRRVAVVLTEARKVTVGQHVYHAPAGQVIRILIIPEGQHFDDGPDTELVASDDLQIGDMVKRG